MSDINIILSILGFLTLMLIIVGVIVFFAISSAIKKNREYEIYAKKHNYNFDKAQGTSNYAMSGKYNKSSRLMLATREVKGAVKQYANYKTYPFGCGVNKRVCYVIEGEYFNNKFRAFTYIFEGNILDKGDARKGGIFSIVMIQMEDSKTLANLPYNVFCEDDIICEYLLSRLDVNSLHSRIENLIKLVK